MIKSPEMSTSDYPIELASQAPPVDLERGAPSPGKLGDPSVDGGAGANWFLFQACVVQAFIWSTSHSRMPIVYRC